MIKDTLYAKYIKDREGLEILEDETAFVTYKIVGQELFVKDVSIDESKRGSLIYSQFLKKLKEIGKENGCDFISSNIHLFDPNATYNLGISIRAGFKVVAANNGVILLTQNIYGGGL